MFVQECAEFGEFTGGVSACDPGFVYGGDFDDEARRCFLQVAHEVCAQSLDVWIGNVLIEVKVKLGFILLLYSLYVYFALR